VARLMTPFSPADWVLPPCTLCSLTIAIADDPSDASRSPIGPRLTRVPVQTGYPDAALERTACIVPVDIFRERAIMVCVSWYRYPYESRGFLILNSRLNVLIV
jgi:hypothetical protein